MRIHKIHLIDLFSHLRLEEHLDHTIYIPAKLKNKNHYSSFYCENKNLS